MSQLINILSLRVFRLRLPILQDVENDRDLLRQDVSIYAERPQKDIHSFIGTLTKVSFHSA